MRVFNNRVNLLVKDQRGVTTWYYVFHDLDAESEWTYKHVVGLIKQGNNKRTKEYPIALMIAHSSIVCEFGTQIMTLKPRKPPKTMQDKLLQRRLDELI